MIGFLKGFGVVLVFGGFIGYLLLRNLPPAHGLIHVCLMLIGGAALAVVALGKNYGLPK